MKLLASLLAVTAFALSSPCLADTFNIFVKFAPAANGLAPVGESTNMNHPDEIVVASYNVGISQRGLNLAGATGAGAGRADLTPMMIYKYLDKASPTLFVACALGISFPKVTLVVERLSGNEPSAPPKKFFKVELRNVFVTSLTQDSSSTDGNGNLVETMALSYSQIRWIYSPTAPDGSILPPFRGGFDVTKNKQLTTEFPEP